MKLAKMALPLIVVLVSGCTSFDSLNDALINRNIQYRYQNAPLVLNYAKAEVIRDQNKVATILVPDNFGLAIDGVVIKEKGGEFNPKLRLSKNDSSASYIVDVLPGAHTLVLSYDRLAPFGSKQTGNASTSPIPVSHSSSVSASMTVPLPAWNKTSDVIHTFKAGEISIISLKAISISIGYESALFPLDEGDRNVIIETRNKAEF
jgi:hypothetical protein